MKTILFFCGALTLWTLQSCQKDNRTTSENESTQVPSEEETPVKLIEYLVGEWQIDAAGGGVTNQEDNAGQRMTFTQEARYIVHRGNAKIDSGAYRMNEQLRNLYLESEANESPREFDIDIQQDVMTLTPKGENVQDTSRLVYRRIGSPSDRPDNSQQ